MRNGSDLDQFNMVSDTSRLTHQNVHYLLKYAYTQSRLKSQESDESSIEEIETEYNGL